MLHLLNFIHWNASPEIFNLGPLSVRWYGLLFASGFLIGYYIGERMFKSEKTPQKWIDSLFFYIIIATIVGARLGHVFFTAGNTIHSIPLRLLRCGMEVLPATEVQSGLLLHF